MAYGNDLYQRVILDHNKNPRNFREISQPTHYSHGQNPLCGDELTLYLKVDSDDTIQDIAFMGHGCAISKASASLMTSTLKGKKVEEAEKMFSSFTELILGEPENIEKAEKMLGRLKIFSGVRDYPSRIKCATLAWHAMKSALKRQETTSTE